MDPDAVLCRLLDAILHDDRDDVVDACLDLVGWIESGGFMPSLTGAAVDEVLTRARRA